MIKGNISSHSAQGLTADDGPLKAEHSGVTTSNGPGFNSAVTHSLTEEHNSNRASSSVTTAPDDNSLKYQPSRAQSDSDAEVSTACLKKKNGKRVAPQQPLDKLDYTDMGLALAGSFLISVAVGVVTALTAGAGAALGAVIGAAALGKAVGAAAVSSTVGAAVGTGIAVGVDAVIVDAVSVDTVGVGGLVDDVGVEAGVDTVVNSAVITR